MAFEAVVRQDAAHVRVADEHHAVEIVGLPFEPVGAGKTEMIDGTCVVLVDRDLDADARVQRRRQEM